MSEFLYYNCNFKGSVIIFIKSHKSYKQWTKYEHWKKVLIFWDYSISKCRNKTSTLRWIRQKYSETWRNYHKINWQPNCRIITIMIDKAVSSIFSSCMSLLLHLNYSRFFVQINAPLGTIARPIMANCSCCSIGY